MSCSFVKVLKNILLITFSINIHVIQRNKLQKVLHYNGFSFENFNYKF